MTLENDYKLTAQEVYRRFISSLPSEVTREYYHRWLHYFMDWMQIGKEEYDRLLDYDPRMLQSKIIDYVIWMKDEKKLSSSSIKIRLAALHHFYDMAEYERSFISQNMNQSRYSENEDEKLLLDEAEQFYNKMLNAITNNCISGIHDTESSPQILQVPDVNGGGPSSVGGDAHMILDTRDLPQINLTYNNIIFQVYPDSEFTNKLNTETSIRARKN